VSRAALAFCAWIVAATLARADLLVLKDGRVVADRKLARVEAGIEIRYENGNVLVPAALVEDAAIDGELVPPPKTAEEQEMAAKGLVRYEGKWITLKRRDELVAKRAAARRKEVEEIAAHREWAKRRTRKTKHFAFEYTVPDAVLDRYAALMEAYFDTFLKEWDIAIPRGLGALTVSVHIDGDAMQQVGGVGPGVLGYFKPSPPMDLNIYFDRNDPELSEEVLFHETNHYLQKLLDLDFRMPHFPGESVAEYYGASRWDPERKKVVTGLVLEGRLCEVKLDIQRGEWMSLRKLVTTDRMYEHYTWGWSLVYFLMKDPRYAKKFPQFVARLVDGKGVKREMLSYDNINTVNADEVWKVFTGELGLADAEAIANLEKEWHVFVDKKLEVTSYHGLARAANQAANHSQPLKAKRLFKEAIERGSESPLTFHGYAKLLATDGDHAQAKELWLRAIALDPLNAEFYAELGRSFRAQGDKDEARRLRRLAREIDPDNAWYLFTDEDLEEIGPGAPKK
jgi:tetratricopeptide (TPR) repeat protein